MALWARWTKKDKLYQNMLMVLQALILHKYEYYGKPISFLSNYYNHEWSGRDYNWYFLTKNIKQSLKLAFSWENQLKYVFFQHQQQIAQILKYLNKSYYNMIIMDFMDVDATFSCMKLTHYNMKRNKKKLAFKILKNQLHF